MISAATIFNICWTNVVLHLLIKIGIVASSNTDNINGSILLLKHLTLPPHGNLCNDD